MRTRTLGPLEVSVVGLGCNNFGGRIDEAATFAVIDAAIDAGVTFFDTSDTYGNQGGSEELIGRALQGRRDRVVLATKWGKPMGDGAERRGSRDYILRCGRGVAAPAADGRDRSLPAPRGGSGDAARGDGRDGRAARRRRERSARGGRRTIAPRRSSACARWHRTRTSPSRASTRCCAVTRRRSCCRRARGSGSGSSRTSRSRAGS